MPSRAPVFRHPSWKPKKAWERPALHQDKRLRGRPGQRLRQQVKSEEPLCRECTAKGLVAATEEVDHIIPLADGGTNDRENMQGLCGACHRAKTQREQAARRGGGAERLG